MPATLRSEEELDRVLGAVNRRLEAAGAEKLTYELNPDSEHGGSRVIATAGVNGSGVRTIIDTNTCNHRSSRSCAGSRNTAAGRRGAVHAAVGDRQEHAATLSEAVAKLMSHARQGLEVKRFKGLGEMNPDQLWKTTMDPAVRVLLQVKIEDAYEADELFPR